MSKAAPKEDSKAGVRGGLVSDIKDKLKVLFGGYEEDPKKAKLYEPLDENVAARPQFLSNLFGYLNREPLDEKLGDRGHLGIPSEIAPKGFPLAQSAKVSLKDLGSPLKGGEYLPETNEININPSGAFYFPGVAPHETAHAMYQTLDTLDKVSWLKLHDALLTNRALGKYNYKEDSSHSFADAFAAYKVAPERVKNHFPEIYAYFNGIETKYKEPRK